MHSNEIQNIYRFGISADEAARIAERAEDEVQFVNIWKTTSWWREANNPQSVRIGKTYRVGPTDEFAIFRGYYYDTQIICGEIVLAGINRKGVWLDKGQKYNVNINRCTHLIEVDYEEPEIPGRPMIGHPDYVASGQCAHDARTREFALARHRQWRIDKEVRCEA
jgi:hypothetical protein